VKPVLPKWEQFHIGKARAKEGTEDIYMRQKFPVVLLLTALTTSLSFGQGTDTRAKATDWEEINFEFNQSVLVDGFPGLLRLANLLKQHPDYKVTLTGNADQIGSDRYNQTLSLKRANTVSMFLQHYGAAAGQIQVKGDGEKNPEVAGRNVNARFINRRVLITATAPDGTQIGDGTLDGAINDFEKYTRGQLGKIDNILSQLHSLEDQVRALQGDSGAIRQSTVAIEKNTTVIGQDTTAIRTDTKELVGRPPPLSAEQTTEIATRAADYALLESALRNKKYGLIGYDIGPTFGNGSKYGTGKTGIFSADVFGRGLIPFGNGKAPDEPGTHGLQVDGKWTYFRKTGSRLDGRSDGMFDLGLVNRFGHLQLGTFAQFDYVSLNAYQGGALLGAGVLTMDFVMPGGVIGVFGAKGFREYANLSSSPGTAAGRTAAYLRYDDQVGFHSAAAIGERFGLESSLAFQKRYLPGATKLPSAMIKLTFSPTDELTFFGQVDENPTYQNLRNTYRAVFGIEFGNWLRPRHYGRTQGVVPVSVPNAHYELLNR
jgi:outer membrane protein OmpA-like peptidoglycan-associated protein